MSRLRQLLLRRALSDGPLYAGMGYGAAFEEMMLAERDGQLVAVDRAGAAYLTITQKGIDAIDAGGAT